MYGYSGTLKGPNTDTAGVTERDMDEKKKRKRKKEKRFFITRSNTPSLVLVGLCRPDLPLA